MTDFHYCHTTNKIINEKNYDEYSSDFCPTLILQYINIHKAITYYKRIQ